MEKSILNKLTQIILISCAGFAANVLAEDAAVGSYEQLGDITVSATRVDKSLYEVPASVGYVGIDDIQLGTQQLGLDEALNKIPGLFMTNRYNFAQDLRISIRGFGSRATFGIRGVKLYVDGIPNTLPDGQGGVDSIDIGSTDHIEVIRGPSSSLYGSSSGGVINIYTEDGPIDAPFLEGRYTVGSDDLQKLQVKTGGQKDALNYLVNLSTLGLEGFRDESHTDNILLNSKVRYDIDATSDLTATVNIVDSPNADDPGAMCSAKSASAFCTVLGSDRTTAQRNNVRFDAGESVSQQQLGLIYRKTFGSKHEITARNYYVWRDFNANLPFGIPIDTGGGIVVLERFFVGGGLQYSLSDQIFGHRNRLTVGFDIDSQRDERKNFTNIRDSFIIGPLVLHQDEDVFNWGVYLQNEFDITDKLGLTFGVRYDEVEFEFDDFYLADADQSGSLTFKEWSPQAGLLWKLRDAINLYGNVSTSFETPSTRGFASLTGGGFNSSLNAQTSTNYEVGVKGLLPGNASYQLSLFSIDTTNELLPLTVNPLGSTVFSNAGETERTGLEVGLAFRPLPGLDVTFNYTYSDFEFETLMVAGTSFAGEKIPGVPEQTGFMEIAYNHPSGLFSVFDIQYVDEVFVNNAYLDDADLGSNLIPQGEAADDYVLANFRMGYIAHTGGNIEFTPFFGINNLFNRKYIGNVRVNEARHKYFEPAPELNFYMGLSVRYQ